MINLQLFACLEFWLGKSIWKCANPKHKLSSKIQAPKSYQNPSSYKPFFNLPKGKDGFRACIQPKEEIGEPIREKREEAYLSMKEGAEIQDTKRSLEALIDGVKWRKWEGKKEDERRRRKSWSNKGSALILDGFWESTGKVQVLPLKWLGEQTIRKWGISGYRKVSAP